MRTWSWPPRDAEHDEEWKAAAEARHEELERLFALWIVCALAAGAAALIAAAAFAKELQQWAQ